MDDRWGYVRQFWGVEADRSRQKENTVHLVVLAKGPDVWERPIADALDVKVLLHFSERIMFLENNKVSDDLVPRNFDADS